MDRGHARHFGDVERVLGELVAEFDPNAVPLCEAPRLWETLAGCARLVASAQMLLAPRVEESGEWKRKGYRSAAEQLAAANGTTVSSARGLLETAHRVAEQPKTERALRAGELSQTKAELVAGAVEVAPEAADELLDMAPTAPVAKVKEATLRTKARVNVDESYARIRRERYAKYAVDEEGAWTFHARGTVDDGALFERVFEPIVDQFFKAAHKDGRREPTEAYAFDALIELARRAGGTSEPGKPSSAPKLLSLLRVDHAALVRGAVEGDEVCEIAGLAQIPVWRARELLGDAVLKLVITKGVDVANVTHLGRGPTVAQKIAMWWRTPQCTNLDCTRVQRIEFDHREEWHQTHHTRIDEGDGLCGHCHDLKTHYGWALIEGDGKRPMVPPDDPRHPKNKPKRRRRR